ncbi:MAG TPA: methionyl-tRNA formyltransferase [Stellaceae bacterium]|nr:methionyl-tRNA formyltransferase [Stellaceae bacterium]
MGAGHQRPGLVFMGTPAFAARILAALIGAGWPILAVYTQPPRPAGRGHRVRPSPVQALAERHGLAVHSPASLRSPEAGAEFARLRPAAAVVAAYGLILPRPMLEVPPLGCLNVHASLLPRWRGAAPIERAILAGDEATGITIMQMTEGLDSGPILLQASLPIGPEANAGSLAAELAEIGARLILEALAAARHGRLEPRPQPQEGVTCAPKVGRAEGRLDWRHEAASLERRVRAFTPAPGAFFEALGERIRVLAAAALPMTGEASPGAVLDDRPAIACGNGALRLMRVQRAGRAPLDAAEFLRGFRLPIGTVLPCPATG